MSATIRKSILGSLLVSFALLLCGGAASADLPAGKFDGRPLSWFSYPIEGVWNAVVNITTCGPTPITLFSFQAMSSYAHGGTYDDTNSTNPALKSASLGVWSHVDGNTYSFAFRFFRFDPTGMPIGTSVVRHTVTLADDLKSYTSSGTGDMYDMAGNLFMTGCSSSTATRFE